MEEDLAILVSFLEVLFKIVPSLPVILLHFSALIDGVLGGSELIGGLEHEAHAALAYLGRLERCIGGLVERFGIGAMGRIHVVQTCAAGDEASGFCVVDADNVAHELGHAVAVEVGWAEGGFGDEPAWREDDKVTHCRAGRIGGAGEHCENGRVRVVVRDGADGVELGKVLAKRIIPELTSKTDTDLGHDSSTNELIRRFRKWRRA